jgi:hypothetical protein
VFFPPFSVAVGLVMFGGRQGGGGWLGRADHRWLVVVGLR